MLTTKTRSGTFIVILFACMLICTLQQRGGSRGSQSSNRESSRSSSRSYHTNHYYPSSSRTSSNCTTINGTTTCISTDSDTEGSSWLLFGGILGLFGVCAYFGYQQNVKQEQKRKEVISGVMSNFEMRMEEWPSVYDEAGRQAMLSTFMNRVYTMVINVKDQTEKFYCQLKVTDLKKITDIKYEIKLTGSDEVGTSKLEGLLMYKADGFGIRLSKVYDDRQKAEQTGSFDVLLYEGAGNPDQLAG
jgi:hypothetical protein